MSAPPLRQAGLLGASALALVLAGLVVLARSLSGTGGASPLRARAAGGESCLGCHDPKEGPPLPPAGGFEARGRSPHSAEALGCAACHLGDPEAFDEAGAHRGLEREPGALATVESTCGRSGCHPVTARQVLGSLMHRNVGLVAVDRFVFGEIDEPTGARSIQAVLGSRRPSPAEDHLRRLCGGCHLGARRANRDDAIVTGGSGCAACHLDGGRTERRGSNTPHPRLVAVPGDAACTGCHSRSARIALTYAGAREVTGPEEICTGAVTIRDGRRLCPAPPDLHAAAGLACVDCHLASEVMGDGVAYRHEEEAVGLTCQDCHGPGRRRVPAGIVREGRLRRILDRRGLVLDPRETLGVTARGEVIWNLMEAPRSWAPLGGGQRPTWLPRPHPTGQAPGRGQPERADLWLMEKRDGRPHPVPSTPVDRTHRRPGHERLTCVACHAMRAPTCPTCHTGPQGGPTWDFGRGASAPGGWRERHEGFELAPPALAVRGGAIVPAVPGMNLELDLPSGARRSLRLVSSFDPHATGSGRSCESCHRSARALGLGRGELRFSAEGVSFERSAEDRRFPGFTDLFPAVPAAGTRKDLRGLNRLEQARILVVGACLGCHPAADRLWTRPFARANDARRRATSRCDARGWRWLGPLGARP